MRRGASGTDAPEDINDRVAVMGRQLWRVVPYATAYPRRLATGMLANACARAADLLPFIAIGWAVDHFTSGAIAGFGPVVDFHGVQSARCWLRPHHFRLLRDARGLRGISEYSWQTLGYKFSTTFAWTPPVTHRDGSVLLRFAANRSNHVGLSSDVNQLEDVVADSSTSIIRIVVTFGFAFLILLSMSWKLAAVIFGPLTFIIPLVYWFSTRVQRR